MNLKIQSLNNNPILKFGREKYNQNDIQVMGSNAVNRKYCIIINAKDNVWLYDLESTRNEINFTIVTNKIPLIGHNKLKIKDIYFTLKTDKTKLL